MIQQNFESAIALFKTKAGNHIEIAVEVANTPEKIAKGFMNRSWFPYGTGMLFRFDKPTKQSFWMLNTQIPLSIAFINDQGRIIDIQEMQSNTLDAHTPPSVYTDAIEVEKGLFDELNIQIGDSVQISEKNYPLILGEKVGYINSPAKATHEGLKSGLDLIPWNEVDTNQLVFKYPRFLNTKNLEKKVGNFKSVEYIKVANFNIQDYQSQSLTKRTANSEEVPKAYARRFASPDDARESWTHISRKAKDKYGIDFDKAVDHVVRSVIQFHGDSTPEEYDSALRFWTHNAATPMKVGEDMGFPRHTLAAALSHFSPATPWHSTNSHDSKTPHNGNVDQFYHALSLVNEAKTTGLKIDNERLSRMQKNLPKIQSVISGTSSFPTNYQIRGETHPDSESAGSSSRRLIVPEKTGTYKIDELADSAIASLLEGQNNGEGRLKGVKTLTSAVREGQTPFRIEHLLTPNYRRGKISSMTDNVENPTTSKRTTQDMWQDALLPTSASFEELEDLNVTSDSANTRGRTPGALNKDKSKAEDASLESFDHETPVRRFGRSAGYQFKDAIMETAHEKLKELGFVPKDSLPPTSQSVSWTSIRSNPTFSQNKKETEKIDPKEIKEELRTPHNQLWIPSIHRDALLVPTTANSNPVCREIHPMIERARQVRAENTNERQIFVPQI